MDDPTAFHLLRAFRAGVYTCLGARRDALFEALDAATSVGPVPSLAYLSLAALHRRGWGSLYAALAAGRQCPRRGGSANPDAAGAVARGEPSAPVCVRRRLRSRNARAGTR